MIARASICLLSFVCIVWHIPLFSGVKVDFLKACVHGKFKEVAKLLDQEGDSLVNLRDKKKNSPLHLVCLSKNTKEIAPLLFLLLDRGASPNARNVYLFTPLHVAASTNNLEAAKTLRHAKGIDPNQTNNRSYTPLHEALVIGSVEMVQILLTYPNVIPDLPTSDGATPLHFASMWGLFEVTKALLSDSRVNPNARQHNGDYIGATPLHFSALQAEPAITKLLLDKGSDPTATIAEGLFEGFTPLHFAVMNPDIARVIQTATFLLEKGADPNQPSALGKTPIDLTNVEIVRNLLKMERKKVGPLHT